MNKQTVINLLLDNKSRIPKKVQGQGFASTNIALCKYWGKRDEELNLPLTSSLSISLGNKGARTTIMQLPINDNKDDIIILNNQQMDNTCEFSKKASAFLDLFRPTFDMKYHIETEVNIPVASGLASSACGFAALSLALNDLYGFELDLAQLSILARLGSGSASRSFWPGFVEWNKGILPNGMDSFATPLTDTWPELRVGIYLAGSGAKPLSSRLAMKQTIETSSLYAHWPEQVTKDLMALKAAIQKKDFLAFGKIAESNALFMHAVMMTAWPPIVYSKPETLSAMHQVWQARKAGLALFFTQDAGPHLKLLFLKADTTAVEQLFPNIEIIAPFSSIEQEAICLK